MSDKHPGHDDIDSLVIRELSRLPAIDPSAGFADRVLTRTRRPQPRAITAYRRAWSWAREPRRAVALATAYALTGLAALAIGVPWLLGHSATMRLAADRAMAGAAALAREWVLAAAAWAASSGLSDAVASLPIRGGYWWLAGVLLTAGYAGCLFGLRLLLRAPRAKNAPVPVAH